VSVHFETLMVGYKSQRRDTKHLEACTKSRDFKEGGYNHWKGHFVANEKAIFLTESG
jgi:hypothetical protein